MRPGWGGTTTGGAGRGGGRGAQLPLPRAREDIADYRGLNAETGSRIRGRRKKSGLVRFTTPTQSMLPNLAAIEARQGVSLKRANARRIRDETGFAIGGVAPIGHLTPMPVFMDETFFAWEALWCAAGRPDNMFAIAPDDLAKATNATIIRVTA